MKPEIAAAESAFRIAQKRVDHLEGKIVKAQSEERPALMDELTTAREELQRIIIPPHPVLRVDDDTPEMMTKELILQGGRLLAASPEVRALENIDQYGDSPKLDLFLNGHAGDDLKCGRISRGRDSIERAALSCVFTPQPYVVSGLAKTPDRRGRGFLARWFYALPASKVGCREIGTAAIPTSIRSCYAAMIRQMWQVEYFDGDEPHKLRFDREAVHRFAMFEQWVEVELRSEGMLADLAGWGNKLCGLTVRIAGILHVGECITMGLAQPHPELSKSVA